MTRWFKWKILVPFFGLAGLGFIVFSDFAMENFPETATNSNISEKAIKIMPLGDSITDGYFVPGGYRVDLWHHLTNRGFEIDFVGSLRNGPRFLRDRHHEGHSGWTIGQIHQRIEGWLKSSDPDLILLLIGTNDMARGDRVETAPHRLQALIETIFQQQPQVTLLVGAIPPIGEPVINQRVIQYNQEMAEIVAQKQAQGDRLFFVDLYWILSLDDLPDGVHPNQEGFRKMALAWDEALSSILTREQLSVNSEQ